MTAAVFSLLITFQTFVLTSVPDYQTVVDVVKTQLSQANLAGVLTYALGAAVVLYFFWWAARSSSRIIVKAFARGKLRF